LPKFFAIPVRTAKPKTLRIPKMVARPVSQNKAERFPLALRNSAVGWTTLRMKAPEITLGKNSIKLFKYTLVFKWNWAINPLSVSSGKTSQMRFAKMTKPRII